MNCIHVRKQCERDVMGSDGHCRRERKKLFDLSVMHHGSSLVNDCVRESVKLVGFTSAANTVQYKTSHIEVNMSAQEDVLMQHCHRFQSQLYLNKKI